MRRAALALALALAGCGAPPSSSTSNGAAPSASSASGRGPTAAKEVRIVTVGGTVTEIVFALGAGSSVVATDTSSVFPAEARKLPQVGYQRTLAAEGIAAQRPTMILVSTEAGPPAAIEQLRSLGIALDVSPGGSTLEAAQARIEHVAAKLDESDKAKELVATLTAQMAEADALVKKATSRPKVLFVYARGAGTLMVSGTDTPADAMIKLAGAENAVTAFTSFKPLTAESVTAAAPDVILVTSRGVESAGGVGAILAAPGMAETPAGKAKKVVALDDQLLLGFGPRLGLGVKELAEKLHPELASP